MFWGYHRFRKHPFLWSLWSQNSKQLKLTSLFETLGRFDCADSTVAIFARLHWHSIALQKWLTYMSSFHLIQTCSQKNVTKLILKLPMKSKTNKWKPFLPRTSFYKHFMKQSLHTSQPHWTFSDLSTPSGLKTHWHIPGTILKKYTFYPNFLRDFLPGLSLFGSFFWFQFNQEVYSSVAATCIFLMMLLEQQRKQKNTWAWFLCTNVLVEIGYKPYNPEHHQTIHTMHHHHHRHHDCFIFDIAEMSALPPSPWQWFWQKGHKRPLTSEKNDSAIRTPSVPNYIEYSIYLFNLVWLRFAFNILQPLHLLFWFHEDNVCLLTRQMRLVCAGSWPMHSPQQPASSRPQAPYTIYIYIYPSLPIANTSILSNHLLEHLQPIFRSDVVIW